MTSHSTTPCLPQSEIETTEQLFDNWFDPIEVAVRERTRDFLQAMFEAESRRGAIALEVCSARQAIERRFAGRA